MSGEGTLYQSATTTDQTATAVVGARARATTIVTLAKKTQVNCRFNLTLMLDQPKIVLQMQTICKPLLLQFDFAELTKIIKFKSNN